MTEPISLKGNSKILPFGSYRLLNNNCPNSDVDLLCVFCNNVTREDIFGGLSKLLESHVEITDLIVCPPSLSLPFSPSPLSISPLSLLPGVPSFL